MGALNPKFIVILILLLWFIFYMVSKIILRAIISIVNSIGPLLMLDAIKSEQTKHNFCSKAIYYLPGK